MRKSHTLKTHSYRTSSLTRHSLLRRPYYFTSGFGKRDDTMPAEISGTKEPYGVVSVSIAPTWRFMGSDKWSDKSLNMGYNYYTEPRKAVHWMLVMRIPN